MTILGITCQRDDGPFLVEWLAHHFAAGFDHMLVLSHDCGDGSDRLLDALAADERITHVSFAPDGKKSVQWQALHIVGQHPLYTSADWALFFDCDEFLSFSHSDMRAALADLAPDPIDALAIPWRLFGSAGHRRRTAGLTPERFKQAAPLDLHFPLGHLFKTVHRPGAFQKPGVHRPRNKKGARAHWRGPDGSDLPEQFAEQDKAISLYGLQKSTPRIVLNHYSLRSTEEFLVKRARGLPNHQSREIGMTYWAERNWNSVAADDIVAMMPKTHDAVKDLMSIPGVDAAYDACCNWHTEKYGDLMQDIETVRLEFRLNLLAGSTPPSAEDGRKFMLKQNEVLRRRAAQ